MEICIRQLLAELEVRKREIGGKYELGLRTHRRSTDVSELKWNLSVAEKELSG